MDSVVRFDVVIVLLCGDRTVAAGKWKNSIRTCCRPVQKHNPNKQSSHLVLYLWEDLEEEEVEEEDDVVACC